MNTHIKGLRSQRKARKWLVEQGYQFVYIIQHSRWSKDISVPLQDSASAKFDGFCFKDGRVAFFQVKTNKMPDLEPYYDFAKKYYIKAIIICINDYGRIEHRIICPPSRGLISIQNEKQKESLEFLRGEIRKW